MIATWIWTFIATVAVTVGALLLNESIRDLQAVKRYDGPKSGPRWILAASMVRSEILRMVTQLGFLVVGIMALLYHGHFPPTWLRWLFTWIFVVASACICANTILNLRVRHRLRVAIDEVDPHNLENDTQVHEPAS